MATEDVIPETELAAAWVRPAVAVAAIGWGANVFAPLIVLYQQHGVSVSATAAMFGLYAVGLIPSLLVGGWWSDRAGRKGVVETALALSMLASTVLLAGCGWHALLFLGRFVAGVSSGLAFGTGAAWIRELSHGHSHQHAGARRATTAMTVGFAGGPLVSGMIAQWAPQPQIWPYAPHLVLCVVALVLLRGRWSLDATPTPKDHRTLGSARPDGSLSRHLRWVTAPFAPWVFGSAAIALAYLPAVVAGSAGSHRLAFAAVATAIPALAGVAVQPLAARVNHRRATGLLVPAMTIAVVALAIATWAAAAATVWAVLVAEIALGVAYGITAYAGLADIQHIANPGQLGAATSAYQALSYLGFALPYLLTLCHSGWGWSPAQGLFVVTVLAVVATAWLVATTRDGEI